MVATHSDRERFDDIVAHLCADDPVFAARVRRATLQRRRRRRTAAAVVLFVLAPLMVILGGWSGLLVAVLAVAEGIRLLLTRGTFSPWTVGSPFGSRLHHRRPPW